MRPDPLCGEGLRNELTKSATATARASSMTYFNSNRALCAMGGPSDVAGKGKSVERAADEPRCSLLPRIGRARSPLRGGVSHGKTECGSVMPLLLARNP